MAGGRHPFPNNSSICFSFAILISEILSIIIDNKHATQVIDEYEKLLSLTNQI